MQNVTAWVMEVTTIHVTGLADNVIVAPMSMDVTAPNVKNISGGMAMLLDAKHVVVITMARRVCSVTW